MDGILASCQVARRLNARLKVRAFLSVERRRMSRELCGWRSGIALLSGPRDRKQRSKSYFMSRKRFNTALKQRV